MNQESRHNFSEQFNDKEVFNDIERARHALALLWHKKEVSLSELQQKLSRNDQLYQQALVEAGYEMTALLNLTTEKSKEKRDIHHLRLASGSEKKRQALENALEGKQIEISVIAPDSSVNDIEQESHRSLRKMIEEGDDRRQGKKIIPTISEYTPGFYAVDVAERKLRAVSNQYPQEALFASDIVVLHGTNMLEKPKNTREAQIMLKQIAGEKIIVSSGSALVTTIFSGGTIIMREGAIMHITLRQYSQKDIDQYLAEFPEFKSIAGTIDYAHPAAQRLISQKPVRIEKLSIEKEKFAENEVNIDPALLIRMRDYCVGMPKEMIQEMVQQAETLQ